MANFLQLNDPNILNQTRNMSWGQALQTENPFSKSYQGYNPSYKGADRTSLKGYAKQGIESLKGNFLKGSNVGGATPLTRKLALGAMDYAPKALGAVSKFLGPASFLFGATPANADEINMTAEDYQNLYAQDQRAQRFKQQQLMNRRKQQMQQRIRQHEAAQAAKQKITPTYTGPVTHDFDPKQDTGRRPDKPGGFLDPGKGSYGPHKAQGGIVDLYRHGGF